MTSSVHHLEYEVLSFTEAYKVGRRSMHHNSKAYKQAMDAQGLEKRLDLYNVDSSYVLLSLLVYLCVVFFYHTHIVGLLGDYRFSRQLLWGRNQHTAVGTMLKKS